MTNLEKYKYKFEKELNNKPFCYIALNLRTNPNVKDWIDCGDCRCSACRKESLEWLTQEYVESKKEFTQDELTILKNIDKKWKWIARDENNGLWVHTKKPTKAHSYWTSNGTFHETSLFNCFKQIQWADSEPVFIDDYVNRKGE